MDCIYILSSLTSAKVVWTGAPKTVGFSFSTGIDSLYVKLEELVPVLINCFLELTSTTRVMDVIDAQSFDCMLSTLQCIYLAIKSLGIEKPSTAVFDGRDVGQKNINVYVKKLWETFPVRQLFQSSEKVCLFFFSNFYGECVQMVGFLDALHSPWICFVQFAQPTRERRMRFLYAFT